MNNKVQINRGIKKRNRERKIKKEVDDIDEEEDRIIR